MIGKKPTARQRRKRSVRKKVFGNLERPRLSVFRSSRNIYAQLIDDVNGQTLASATTLETSFRENNKHGGNINAAKEVGRMIAEKAKAQDIEKVVFDRSSYRYHGRVKALAEAARENGLKF